MCLLRLVQQKFRKGDIRWPQFNFTVQENSLTLLSKFVKSANAPELFENGSCCCAAGVGVVPTLPPNGSAANGSTWVPGLLNGSLLAPASLTAVGSGLGVGGSGAARIVGCWRGRGGAGRGGGCLLFFGGNAGLGLSGRGGGLLLAGWRVANGSHPNGSLPDTWNKNKLKITTQMNH